jgi:hypothetical protein
MLTTVSIFIDNLLRQGVDEPLIAKSVRNLARQGQPPSGA